MVHSFQSQTTFDEEESGKVIGTVAVGNREEVAHTHWFLNIMDA